VQVLLDEAAALSIGADDQATLKVATVKRAKEVADLPAAQRASLDALLSRLSTPRGRSRQDLLVAVAARSLAMQLGYWDGDMQGQYGSRRDAGMASLTSFLVSQLAVKRAALWAHDGHISKEGNRRPLGQNLASNPSLRYYGIGFYLYEGSVRAWDGAAKIGVISHPIPAAPPYTMEGAVMRATGSPDIAWLSLRTLPTAFRSWLATPRFVREDHDAAAPDTQGLRCRRRDQDRPRFHADAHRSSQGRT
jgi:erythromycin esterase-like protein